MLYIFSGLPGVGKSTLAQRLARAQRAAYLRIDTIEQTLREAGALNNGTEGYLVAYRLAADDLRLGLSVVADCVNPLRITRASWRSVATDAGAPFVEIEVVCSSESEHRGRIEGRSASKSTELPGWDEVRNRTYEPWDTGRIIIDTAGQSVEQSAATLFEKLATLKAV